MNRSTRHSRIVRRCLIGIVLVAAIVAVRDHVRPPHGTTTSTSALATRAVADAVVDMPATWRTLARERDTATWGDASHRHTVTLAATDVSEASLASVVHDLAKAAGSLGAGVRLRGAPQARDVLRGARGDSAFVLRLEVARSGSAPLQVIQVWRRDTRAGRDVVATWTSSDGRWLGDPTALLPSSRLR